MGDVHFVRRLFMRIGLYSVVVGIVCVALPASASKISTSGTIGLESLGPGNFSNTESLDGFKAMGVKGKLIAVTFFGGNGFADIDMLAENSSDDPAFLN